MSVLLFPGQGSQFVGMGKDSYEASDEAKKWFHQADDQLGYKLSSIMFDGTDEDLKQTKVTQPAVFLHTIIRYYLYSDNVQASAVAGHSLGEITALVANGVLSFSDGLNLVQQRSLVMQDACNETEGTMAAILGLEDEKVESICNGIDAVVVAANYNCPGQLVISGSIAGINKAVEVAKEQGAKRALVLNVNGAFHSPLMLPAQDTLQKTIEETTFNKATCPIYQNVNGEATTDTELIQLNLIKQLTSPVRWTQTMKNMVADGHKDYNEYGAKVLSGFFRRIDRSLVVNQV